MWEYNVYYVKNGVSGSFIIEGNEHNIDKLIREHLMHEYEHYEYRLIDKK